MSESPRCLLWILRLVPKVAGGRWLSALLLFAGLAAIYLWVALAAAEQAPDGGLPNWSVTLFFCLILAYIPATFHLVTERTEIAFDALRERLALTVEEGEALRRRIRYKTPLWVTLNLMLGLAMYVLQSLVLSGGWERMLNFALSGPVEFAGAIGPLPVWLFMTCALHALVDNARLFRELSRQTPIDIHDHRALLPFGSMAVSSILLIVGAQALFPVMWLGGEISVWTTIPGLLATIVPMVFLFAAPIWPLHQRLQAQKQKALNEAQQQINALTAANPTPASDLATLTPLLAYRRELAATSEWPFSVGLLSRLGFYLFIVPFTWVGAALIEILVDLFLAS